MSPRSRPCQFSGLFHQLTFVPMACSFGMASIALSLIPLFGPALMFTTAIGAALWAADIERNERGTSDSNKEVGGKDQVEVHPGRLDL